MSICINKCYNTPPWVPLNLEKQWTIAEEKLLWKHPSHHSWSQLLANFFCVWEKIMPLQFAKVGRGPFFECWIGQKASAFERQVWMTKPKTLDQFTQDLLDKSHNLYLLLFCSSKKYTQVFFSLLLVCTLANLSKELINAVFHFLES